MEIVWLGVVLLLLAPMIVPLIYFFVAVNRYEKTVPAAEEAAGLAHARVAKRQLAIAVVIGTILLLVSPVTPLFRAALDVSKHVGLDILGILVPAIAGALCAMVAAARGIKHARLAGMLPMHALWNKAAAVAAQAGLAAHIAGAAGEAFRGLGWGRPLRVGGAILKPDLCVGDVWAQGERPCVSELDAPTRLALEALWLHDARKEYASVPGFSRLGWQLAALAAPPDLLRDVHLAALQEIEHARKCFALAAGFGQQAQTVMPTPAMLAETASMPGDALTQIAEESLIDGCLLEGFNGDIASRSAEICNDPVSLKVIRQIAREERSHAELSWRILEFCWRQAPEIVGPALRKHMDLLSRTLRPTAASLQNLPLVEAASQEDLVRYGRLPDSEFSAIWIARIQDTQERIESLLKRSTPLAASQTS